MRCSLVLSAIIILLLLIIFIGLPNVAKIIVIGVALLAISYKNNSITTGGNEIDYILENLSSAVELGRGGAGIVYAFPTVFPRYAFKLSHDKGECKLWNDEYNKTIELQNLLPTNKYKYIDFAYVMNYTQKEKICVMQMDRILNPDGDNYMIHEYLGESLDYNMLIKNRGRFIGYNNIIKYIPENQIQDYIKELGDFIGCMHYLAKYDGYDLEIIIGKKIEDDTIKLYVIDFDQIKKIENYDENTIQRIVETFTYLNYFPSPETPYYVDFKKSYLSVAKKYDKLDIAETIIKQVEEYY